MKRQLHAKKKFDYIHCGDCLEWMKTLATESVQCCITSPPYWGLRNYGVDGQLGLEETPEEYVSKLVEVFREVRRVLRKDGTLWLNLGDTYAGGGRGCKSQKQVSNRGTHNMPKSIIPPGCKPKNLVGIPWRVALALQADGYWLRSDIIWHKPNSMPESVTDRPTRSHEYLFLLSKSAKYYYDVDAIREKQKASSLKAYKYVCKYKNKKRDWPGGIQNNIEKYQGKTREEIAKLPGRNKRSVWTVAHLPYKIAHFATFPEKLIEPCVLAGCPDGGVIMDPFMGSGTVGLVCYKRWRRYIGCDLKREYVDMALARIRKGER